MGASVTTISPHRVGPTLDQQCPGVDLIVDFSDWPQGVDIWGCWGCTKRCLSLSIRPCSPEFLAPSQRSSSYVLQWWTHRCLNSTVWWRCWNKVMELFRNFYHQAFLDKRSFFTGRLAPLLWNWQIWHIKNEFRGNLVFMTSFKTEVSFLINIWYTNKQSLW